MVLADAIRSCSQKIYQEIHELDEYQSSKGKYVSFRSQQLGAPGERLLGQDVTVVWHAIRERGASRPRFVVLKSATG
jgi:hypothetical protein